jgi:ectoine hydroxylase-related dioxygenase (phytanoyl-CoA dioxygenase family)
MLTPGQIDFYHTNGYVGVPDVLTVAELEELRSVTDEFVEKSRLVTEHTAVYDLEPGHSPEAPRLRRLKEPIAQHPVYARMLTHERILEMVEQLIGPAIRCNGTKLNLKYPKFGSPVEWHQDWAFYPHTNDSLLSVGIAIDAMNRRNGCLQITPKSHRGPVYDHHKDGYFIGAITDPEFSTDDAVSMELPAGGISLHHVRTCHGSAPNRGDVPRRLLLFQYAAADAWPLVTAPPWEEFEANMLRGESTTQPRLTSVPVRVPLPMKDPTDSIYEFQTELDKSYFEQPVDDAPSTSAPADSC